MKPFPPAMCEGSVGPHVSVVHIILFMAERYEDLLFDCLYGPITTHCVKGFQSDLNVKETGFLD
jgi:hypothetical protein